MNSMKYLLVLGLASAVFSAPAFGAESAGSYDTKIMQKIDADHRGEVRTGSFAQRKAQAKQAYESQSQSSGVASTSAKSAPAPMPSTLSKVVSTVKAKPAPAAPKVTPASSASSRH